MVGLVWFCWFMMVVFLFIILCNFMISYIGQSYEEVLEHQIENKYSQRCELNTEFYTLYDFLRGFFKGDKKEMAIFLLTGDFEGYLDIHSQEQENGYSGVVKKLKVAMLKQKEDILREIREMKNEI